MDAFLRDATTGYIVAAKRKIHTVSISDKHGLSSANLALWKMHVHFVAIKVRIVRIGISIMHADRLLAL